MHSECIKSVLRVCAITLLKADAVPDGVGAARAAIASAAALAAAPKNISQLHTNEGVAHLASKLAHPSKHWLYLTFSSFWVASLQAQKVIARPMASELAQAALVVASSPNSLEDIAR